MDLPLNINLRIIIISSIIERFGLESESYKIVIVGPRQIIYYLDVCIIFEVVAAIKGGCWDYLRKCSLE